MTPPTRSERRRFLKGLLAAAAAATAPGGARASSVTLSHSAQVVGRAYLRQTPSERDARVLIRALAADHPSGPDAFERLDHAALQRALLTRIQQDFAHERVVVVDGWVLARSEARLCALAALSGPSDPSVR